MEREHPIDRRDGLVAVLIVAVFVLALGVLPDNLGAADESIHLYDAKRLLHGAVMYRDVFNHITPGWMYLMALVFWLFGTTVAVARTAMAIIHGLAGACMYASGRALDVRRSLAWLPAVAYLVMSQPAWPIASQHWLSTFLSVVVLWLCVLHLQDRTRWAVRLGVVLGLFVAVQQQRAAFTAGGVALWLVLDHLLQRWCRRDTSLRSLVDALVQVAIGGALVVIPLFVWLIAQAGFHSVWRALVIFPLYDYGGTTHCPWGEINIVTLWQGSFTFPRLLKYQPVVLLPALGRLAVALIRRRPLEEARRLLLLIVLTLTSMASISYFPDFIHIAFIAPAFLVTLIESAEWAVHRLPTRQPLLRAAGLIAAGAFLVACVIHLENNRTRLRAAFPLSRETAFGRVDMNDRDVQIYDKVKALLDGTSTRSLYCYPVIAHLYLLLDVENPTPYGFFVPGLNGPDLVQDALNRLEAKPPPYVVFFSSMSGPNDPVGAWIRAHYEPVETEGPLAGLVMRRRAS